MTIEILDTSLEDRLNRHLASVGASNPEDALRTLLDTQEEQDRWLLDLKPAINAKIRLGLGQLDRGEIIWDDQLEAYLTELKAQPA